MIAVTTNNTIKTHTWDSYEDDSGTWKLEWLFTAYSYGIGDFLTSNATTNSGIPICFAQFILGRPIT